MYESGAQSRGVTTRRRQNKFTTIEKTPFAARETRTSKYGPKKQRSSILKLATHPRQKRKYLGPKDRVYKKGTDKHKDPPKVNK